jgi:hypothetical protein
MFVMAAFPDYSKNKVTACFKTIFIFIGVLVIDESISQPHPQYSSGNAAHY